MKKLDPEHISWELTVGEVAARSGVAVSTLHYYESKGLIKSWRNQGMGSGNAGIERTNSRSIFCRWRDARYQVHHPIVLRNMTLFRSYPSSA